MPTPAPAAEFSIAIIGAGFSGIGMAIRLKQAGIHSFTIYEASDRVGGTWRDNTYPGCACDVPSHLYSFSFEPNPDWSRKFGEQPEILAYIERCVARYGLGPHLRLGTGITDARFDEKSATWRLATSRGDTVSARVVVAGTGPLSRPATPPIPGLDRFAGPSFHSARWDHDYDLAGKRVAVVGTGASAVQFVPRIAPKVDKLHLFQRTPPWILPKLDRVFSDSARRVFNHVPFAERLYRWLTYASFESRAYAFVVDPRLMKYAAKIARRHIRAQIPDPALQAVVTPDYTPGCKRVLLSNDYYPALTRDNVEVIPHGVAKIRERSIVGSDGTEREVDAIIFGTGFDVAGIAHAVPVTGLGGRTLANEWREIPEAFLGLAVSGFPNFYLLVTGPNTGLGHNSIIFMIEAQVDYVLQCIDRLRKGSLRYLDVDADRQRAFSKRIRARTEGKVWQSGCKSWYLDDKGRNYAIWPGYTVEYWLRTRRLDRSAFREES